MNENNFPVSDDVNMSCNPPFSRLLLGVVILAAVVVALISGPSQALADEGYWKYDGYQLYPTNEYYKTIKALPGHVYEMRATGAVQAGPGDGVGSLDLFFKTDDADRVQYLATSTLTFHARANLTTLVPLQKVEFEVSIVVGGNDKCRAMPAKGNAHIVIGFTAENFVQVGTTFGQTASAKGEATIPGGGPGATMIIIVGSNLGQWSAMNEELRLSYVWVEGTPPPPVSPPKPSQFADYLGNILTVKEVAGGSVYDGTWTRRSGTDVFDAVWNGSERDVIEIESVNGNQIVFYRHGNKGRYYGTLSADGVRVTSGTASWYAAGWSWSATVSGRPPAP
jgi:hypothetical protein